MVISSHKLFVAFLTSRTPCPSEWAWDIIICWLPQVALQNRRPDFLTWQRLPLWADWKGSHCGCQKHGLEETGLKVQVRGFGLMAPRLAVVSSCRGLGCPLVLRLDKNFLLRFWRVASFGETQPLLRPHRAHFRCSPSSHPCPPFT